VMVDQQAMKMTPKPDVATKLRPNPDA